MSETIRCACGEPDCRCDCSECRPYHALAGLRRRHGLSQAEVARRIGAHAMTISRYERGEFPVSDENAEKLGQLYRLTADDIRNASFQAWRRHAMRRLETRYKPEVNPDEP